MIRKMCVSKIYSYLTISAVVLFPTSANSSCELAKFAIAVVDFFEVAHQQNGVLDDEQWKNVDTLLNENEFSGADDDEFQVLGGGQGPLVRLLGLLFEGRELGNLELSSRELEDLSSLRTAAIEHCPDYDFESSSSADPASSELWRTDEWRTAQERSPKKITSRREDIEVDDTPGGSFLYLVAILAAIVGLILASKYIYSWIYSFVFSRRRCLIPANIIFDDARYLGHIIILGLKGCRFSVIDKFDQEEVSRLNPVECKVRVGDVELHGNVIGIRKSFVSIFFVKPIPRKIQKFFLTYSTVVPTYDNTPIYKGRGRS